MVANAKTSFVSAKTSLATAVLRLVGEDFAVDVPAADGSANTDIVGIKRRGR